MTTTRTTALFTLFGLFGKPRAISLTVLMSLSACGPAKLTGPGGADESTGDTGEPAELTGPGGADESTGDTGESAELTGQGGTDESTEDTGEPDEALGPACQFEWEWRQRVDSTQWLPNLHDVDVDEAGNVYAVGSLEVALYEPDIWVASWAPDGTQAWVRTFGEPGQIDFGQSLRVGPDGGLFVLGTVRVGESPALWLARLDPKTGDELWSQIDTSGFALDLAPTADDQLIVLGGQTPYITYVPWLSQRSPVDGSVAWTRSDEVAVGPGKYQTSIHALAVSDTGDLRVAGIWDYTEWQGDFSPQGGDLLLTYDPLGELLEVELTSEDPGSRRGVLIDGSASVYFLSEVEVESGHAPVQLESRAANGSLEWLIAESEWSVGQGLSELIVIDLGEGALDIAGFTRDFPNSGPLWTAKIDPDSGALTRGCVHMLEDPDTGEPMWQRITAGASGPAGGLAIYGEEYSVGSHWMWMGYLGE
jgi:hypothetical protein